MINVVIDTNVYISSVIKPGGIPTAVIDIATTGGDVELIYNLEIFAEYDRVFSYPKLKIPPEKKLMILTEIKNSGIIVIPTKSDIIFKDESDRIFYDTAKHSGAILITGNLKDFPKEDFIMSPADFVGKYG